MQEREVLDAKYAIVRSLGQGSAAVVYEAENLLLGKRVAIKHFRPGAIPPEMSVDEFLQILRTSANLDHPNITPLLDMGVDESRPYAVSDCLRGNDLDREIAGAGRPGIPACGDLILQVLSAIDYAREQEVFHGALHPGNVVVVYPRPGVPWVKITDFGVYQALWRHSTQRPGPHTAGPYLAPELERGEVPTAAADVYSAAALMYALLHGEPPNEENRGAQTGGTRLPKPLAQLIRRALSSDPASRPTAEQFGLQLAAETQTAPPYPRGLSAPPSIRWLDQDNTTPGSLRIYGRAALSEGDPLLLLNQSAASPAVSESLLRNPRFPKPPRGGIAPKLNSVVQRARDNPNATAAWAFAIASLVAGIAFTLLATWLQ